jgi:hypothetical protein
LKETASSNLYVDADQGLLAGRLNARIVARCDGFEVAV